jgi:hypothetical protein
LWYAFRDTNWDEQWASLRAANLWWGVPYLFILLCIHLCRTLRWGSLLSGLERVRFRELNEASGIGFMLLIALPFRLGEFARPFLIAQRSKIHRSPAMTTVVLERIVDGIAVAALLRGLLFFIPRSAPGYGVVSVAGNGMFLIFAGGLAFLLFAWWQRDRAVWLVRKVAAPISPKAANEVARIVDSFVGAMHQLPSPMELAKFFAYTVVYWGLNGFGMMIMARAFEAPAVGIAAPLQVDLFLAYVVMCTLVVAVMIPSAPGMAGTFQVGIKFGLGLFLPEALVNSKGLAYANVLWLFQTTQQIGLGLILLWISRLSLRGITGKLTEEQAAEKQGGRPLLDRVAASNQLDK